jgi:hypothetical protein
MGKQKGTGNSGQRAAEGNREKGVGSSPEQSRAEQTRFENRGTKDSTTLGAFMAYVEKMNYHSGNDYLLETKEYKALKEAYSAQGTADSEEKKEGEGK